jgi:hypothetical protein
MCMEYVCAVTVAPHGTSPTAKIRIEAEQLPCVPYIYIMCGVNIVYIIYMCYVYK